MSYSKWLLFIGGMCTLLASSSDAFGQWNPGKQLRDAAKRGENAVRKEAGRASKSMKRQIHGKEFLMVFRNPGKSGIPFYIDDYPLYVGPGQSLRVKHRSRSLPRIKFGYGFGEGYRTYKLKSGKFVFDWRDEHVATYGNMRLLNLFNDR